MQYKIHFAESVAPASASHFSSAFSTCARNRGLPLTLQLVPLTVLAACSKVRVVVVVATNADSATAKAAAATTKLLLIHCYSAYDELQRRRRR